MESRAPQPRQPSRITLGHSVREAESRLSPQLKISASYILPPRRSGSVAYAHLASTRIVGPDPVMGSRSLKCQGRCDCLQDPGGKYEPGLVRWWPGLQSAKRIAWNWFLGGSPAPRCFLRKWRKLFPSTTPPPNPHTSFPSLPRERSRFQTSLRRPQPQKVSEGQGIWWTAMPRPKLSLQGPGKRRP